MSVVDISKRSPEELKRTQFEANESAIQDAEFTVRTPEIVAAEIRQIAERTPEIVAAEIRQIKELSQQAVADSLHCSLVSYSG